MAAQKKRALSTLRATSYELRTEDLQHGQLIENSLKSLTRSSVR